MFDTPPPERKKKDEESETRVRMNCHSGKVKRVVIRRAWKTQRHTHTHTPRTGAHPSSGVVFESPGVKGTAANETLLDSQHGTLRRYRTTERLPSRLLPLTLRCGSRRRSTGVRRSLFLQGGRARALAPQNFRRRLLHDVRCWNPAPKRDGTGRPWSAISWTRLASPVHSGQRPLAGRDS